MTDKATRVNLVLSLVATIGSVGSVLVNMNAGGAERVSLDVALYGMIPAMAYVCFCVLFWIKYVFDKEKTSKGLGLNLVVSVVAFVVNFGVIMLNGFTLLVASFG